MINGVSIIICCYNSASRIEETLKSIFNLDIPSEFLCEVIVINNNSTDETLKVAQAATKTFGTGLMSFKIVEEQRPGLTFARNKGIEESSYDLILFCDDDNHLDKGYLRAAQKVFASHKEVGIAGGWSKPKFSSNPGLWIEDFYGALAIGKQSKEDGVVRWVFGAGMLFKKEILTELKKAKIKFLLTDRIGSKQTSGGDTEMCLLAKFIGYDSYYSESLQLDHCISPHRLTKKNFIKLSSENFYPVMHLFLLDKIVYKEGTSPLRLFTILFFDRMYRIFYFIPRCFVGRHRFYSFISVYSNALFVSWLLLNGRFFFKTYNLVSLNLGDHG